jgi:hypothetical protein
MVLWLPLYTCRVESGVTNECAKKLHECQQQNEPKSDDIERHDPV